MDKKLLFLLIIFFFSFLSFTYVSLKRSPFTTLIRATEEVEPSSENSMIFAWPLSVKVVEKTPVKITVFVRNKKNIPLANKKITLITSLGTINNNNVNTDKNGKAEFILENSTLGTAIIEAVVNDTLKLDKKVTIKFE